MSASCSKMRCWTGRRRASDEGERLTDGASPDTWSRNLSIDIWISSYQYIWIQYGKISGLTMVRNLTRVDFTRMTVFKERSRDVFVIVFSSL